MPWIGGALALGGALISSDAAKSAADTQANAQQQGTAAQMQMFNTVNDQQAPYRQTGATALKDLGYFTGINGASGDFNGDPNSFGSLTHTFNANDLGTNLDPSYAFRRDQTLGAANNLLNASGSNVSGNTLKGVMDYGNNLATTGYQQAYQNYNTNQTNIYNRLASIAGLGQTAGSNATTGASTFSGNIGNSIAATGAAQAGGQVGAANALSGGINNAMGWYSLNKIMNPGGTGIGGVGGGLDT